MDLLAAVIGSLDLTRFLLTKANRTLDGLGCPVLLRVQCTLIKHHSFPFHPFFEHATGLEGWDSPPDVIQFYLDFGCVALRGSGACSITHHDSYMVTRSKDQSLRAFSTRKPIKEGSFAVFLQTHSFFLVNSMHIVEGKVLRSLIECSGRKSLTVKRRFHRY